MALQIDDYGGSNAIAENINAQPSGFFPTLWDGIKQAYNTVGGAIGLPKVSASNYEAEPILNQIKEIKESFTPYESAREKAKETPTAESQPQETESEAMENYLKQLREWELEERAHAEEREDTAYQRAIADMRKAGWNTDGMTPQASPTGARLDSTRSEGEKDRQTQLKMLYKQLEVAIAEGQKDRIMSLVNAIISLGGSLVNPLIPRTINTAKIK